MGKNKDMSPRKIAKIELLLAETNLKQSEIARKVNASQQSVSLIKKKYENRLTLDNRRKGNCGRKRNTTPRIDRKIKNLALKNRKASCKQISGMLANEGILVDRKTVNNRLLEANLRAYRPRRKPLLTKAMIQSRREWALQHKSWTINDWKKVLQRIYHIYV